MNRFALSIGAGLLAAVAAATPAAAQQLTAVWQPTDSGDWNFNDNWDLDGSNLVPEADPFGDHAQIANGGTAVIAEAVPDVANVSITGGSTVLLQSGGSLGLVVPSGIDDVGGDLTIGGGSSLTFDGGGDVSTELNVFNNGTISFQGGGSLDVGGSYSGVGSIAVDLNGFAGPAVNVAGTANLNGGMVAPSFDGIESIGFGDSWDILAADEIVGELGFDPALDDLLPEGLRFRSNSAGGVASLEVSNRLVLTVDRGTGDVAASNPAGGAIDVRGYTIGSPSGYLSVDGWQSLQDVGSPGFEEANPSSSYLNELRLDGAATLDVGASQSLGAAYVPGPQTPAEEDVFFEYVAGDGEVVTGLVQYVGPVADLVLRVDDAGMGALFTESPFFQSDVKAYSIFSASGALLADGWNSLQDGGTAGWEEANPTAESLTELNLSDSTSISNGVMFELGAIFDAAGERDLLLEYVNAAGDVLTGTVEYGDLPIFVGCDSPLAGLGDANCDRSVDLADFNVLKSNFNTSGPDVDREEGDFNGDMAVDLADFNILKANFNTSAAVPEPATWILAAGAIGCWGLLRRR